MDMLANIRRIGIFMIAAQTIIHFAAGQKYEKYLKIIAGVIILLQFISPFVSSSGEVVVKWQEEIRMAVEQAERQSSFRQEESYPFNSAETVAVRKIEEEMKKRLNDVIDGQEYYVADLSVELEQIDKKSVPGMDSDGDGWEFRCVRTVLRRREDAYINQNEPPDQNTEHIKIEEIVIGDKREEEERHEGLQDTTQDEIMREYRQIFAQTLGITAGRVEVTYDGE